MLCSGFLWGVQTLSHELARAHREPRCGGKLLVCLPELVKGVAVLGYFGRFAAWLWRLLLFGGAEPNQLSTSWKRSVCFLMSRLSIRCNQMKFSADERLRGPVW